MSERILVTGGTGLLGSRLVGLLRDDGFEVVVTSRNRDRAEAKFGEAVTCVQWDYVNETFPAEALDGVRAVYHLMGENIGTGRWTAKKKEILRSSRILSTEKLVAALPDSVEDFLCASAIGIYPGDTTERFDEDSHLPEPDDFMTRLCRDWESAGALAESPGRRVASLRIGIVLAESGMLGPLVPLYRLGLGGPVGSGRQMLPWVHIDDLVDMLRFVLDHRALSGAINLVGPSPTTLKELSRTLARLLRRPHFMRVPEFAIRLALGEAAALVLSSYDVHPRRLRDAGFEYRYEMLEGALEDALRAIR